jgi:hypothetical protein
VEDNEVLIQKEADLMRNEIVLDVFETYRLLGWTDQFEEDYYWVVLTRRVSVGVSIELYSCVGSFIRLKGFISNKDYFSIEDGWNRNGASIEDGLRLAEKEGIIIK